MWGEAGAWLDDLWVGCFFSQTPELNFSLHESYTWRCSTFRSVGGYVDRLGSVRSAAAAIDRVVGRDIDRLGSVRSAATLGGRAGATSVDRPLRRSMGACARVRSGQNRCVVRSEAPCERRRLTYRRLGPTDRRIDCFIHDVAAVYIARPLHAHCTPIARTIARPIAHCENTRESCSYMI